MNDNFGIYFAGISDLSVVWRDSSLGHGVQGDGEPQEEAGSRRLLCHSDHS